MARYEHRSPTPTNTRFSWTHPQASIAGVQVIQYRSYQREISIYHLRTQLLPLRLVRTALQSQKEYVDRLTSFDPLQHIDTIEGDETPAGCIETAYLPNILHGHGSALAIRSEQEPGRVEWFIFSGPVDETFLSRLISEYDSWVLQDEDEVDRSRTVFDLVGWAEKGLKTRTVRGANREHKGWHDSLCAAEEVKKSVKLTWKGFGVDLRAERERTQQREGVNSGTTMSGAEEMDISDKDRDQANVTIRSRRKVQVIETPAVKRDAEKASPLRIPPPEMGCQEEGQKAGINQCHM